MLTSSMSNQDMIRSFYGVVLNGREITPHHRYHMEHCIEYLRQSIVCSADPTLEETHEHPQHHGPISNGANTTHNCRSWDQLKDWAAGRAVTNSTSILSDIDN
jgi:hypothetical protein